MQGLNGVWNRKVQHSICMHGSLDLPVRCIALAVVQQCGFQLGPTSTRTNVSKAQITWCTEFEQRSIQAATSTRTLTLSWCVHCLLPVCQWFQLQVQKHEKSAYRTRVSGKNQKEKARPPIYQLIFFRLMAKLLYRNLIFLYIKRLQLRHNEMLLTEVRVLYICTVHA